MAKRKQKAKVPVALPDELPDVVYLSSYEITDKQLMDRNYKRLPESVKDAAERLYYEAQSDPQKAIPELHELRRKYPKIPQFYNFLATTYSRIGENEKALAIIQECMRINPDYLFARLNYAEFLLADGKYDKIPELFDYSFDLKLLYPNRNRFHISEVVGFMGIMGVYFSATGEREAAERYYEVLQKIAPEHEMTKRLKRNLHPGIVERTLRRLAGE